MFCLFGWIKCGSVVGAHPCLPAARAEEQSLPARPASLPLVKLRVPPPRWRPRYSRIPPLRCLQTPLPATLHTPPRRCRAAHRPAASRAARGSPFPPLAVLLTDPAAGHAACASLPLAALLAVPASPPLVALLADPTAGRAARGPHRRSCCSRFPPPRRRPRCTCLRAAGHAACSSSEMSTVHCERPSQQGDSRESQQKIIRVGKTTWAKSGYRYTWVMAGWPQPRFKGIFYRICLSLTIAASEPNTGKPIEKWTSLTI
jgi:hypothetical protein